VQPDRGELFQLDASILRTNLAKVRRGEPVAATQIGSELELPMPDGSFARFKIVEAPIMAPELAAKFPEIKTYAGVGIDDPDATIRLDLTPLGFHAQVLSPRGAVYVDPAYRGDSIVHVSYFKRDLRKMSDEFECFTAGRGTTTNSDGTVQTTKLAARTLSGATLRTYRLAVAATAEYTQKVGNSTVEGGLAKVVTAVNRVDGVYETELAVRLVLVANNDLLIYTDANTDPYTNNDASLLLSENQSNIDSVIGSANYDIGHVFSTAGGGLASLGVVCDPGYKAQGETGMDNPEGDAFYIDYVAHEMGHQFGANHTFNSTSGSCGGGTREATVAYEPGSGSTIMAYAGICSPNDLQAHSDPYFHAGSLNEIQTYLSSSGSCAGMTSTTNNPPSVSAGSTNSIPKGTPFKLTAVGSDPQGETVTYCWEEMDLGPATSLTSADNGSSPLFRSLSPTTNASRYFPKLNSVLANTNWNQEIIPSVSRSMHFRVTARDNRLGGGGVADSDTQVNVISTAGPFAVTSPNTTVTWSGNQTVTWNVASTTASPISASLVNIYLSTDGGNTFPYQLATNVANNGSRLVALPNIIASRARIKIEPVGNIFYDISDVNFTLAPFGPYLQTTGISLASESCSPANGAIDPYEAVTVDWSLKNIGPVPTTNLIATLLAANGIYYPSNPQSYGTVAANQTVARSFSFVPSGTCGGSVTGVVQLTDGGADMGRLTNVFALGAFQSSLATQVVANASAIVIPDVGTATPYPSSIVVSGVTGTVIRAMATLSGFGHTYPSDVAVLLVAPNGNAVKLIDSCGANGSVSGLTFTFDDAALGSLPSTAFLTSGTYKPTDNGNNTLSGPAPAPSGTTIAPLLTVPNGTWSLYVQDLFSPDSGGITGGWSLKLISSNAVATCCTTFPAPTFTSTTYSNEVVRFSWSAIPGPHYQVQYRTNLIAGSWQNLGSPILGTNTLLNVTDYLTNGPTRFYRVVVSQ
jgi:hypothetical protein